MLLMCRFIFDRLQTCGWTDITADILSFQTYTVSFHLIVLSRMYQSKLSSNVMIGTIPGNLPTEREKNSGVLFLLCGPVFITVEDGILYFSISSCVSLLLPSTNGPWLL